MLRFFSTLFVFVFSISLLHAGKQIVVDLSKQEAYAYENGRLLFSGWISTGKPGHRTPTGRFRVLEKDIDHVSSRYPEPNGGAEMHYMLRVTGYGVAMHLGYVPNYPASHGCIRMENGFAQKMYHWADVGTPILIKGTPPRRVDRPIHRNAPRVARASGSGSAGGVLGNDPLKFLSSVPARRQALAAADAKKKKKKNRAARSRSVETPGSNDPLVFLSSVPAKRQALAAAEAKKRKQVAARKKRRQHEVVENQKPLTPLEALKG
jgi:hypothetical protein